MPHFGRLLVTGAGGFVGRHLLKQLRESFPLAELVAAVRPEAGQLIPVSGANRIVKFELSSSSHDEMITAVQPDGLIHLAAQASVAASFANPVDSWQANLMGTIKLAEAVLRQAPHCRFILASSAEIYGLSFQVGNPLNESALLCPTNPYAASKAACDLAIGELALRGLDAIRLRAFNHTGPGQSDQFVVSSFARQIARIEAGQQDPIMKVGALDRWRDFLDVSDVCAAYVAALTTETASGAIYNIASGQSRRIGDILDALTALSNVKPQIEVQAVRLRPTDVERITGDSTKAAQHLNWSPVTPWENTLSNVLSYWRNH